MAAGSKKQTQISQARGNSQAPNYARRADEVLEMLLSRRRSRSTEVQFRELVKWLPYNSERFTHAIHHYPAKLIPQIPNLFISSSLFSAPGDLVLDPFCGTGTVLLETILAGRNGFGADSNPLARLISAAKTTSLSCERLAAGRRAFNSAYKREWREDSPDVVNLEYWFYPHITRKLSRIYSAISAVRDIDVQRLFLVSFSNCLRKLSLADPRISVPVRANPGKYPLKHILRAKYEDRLRRLKRINVFSEFERVLDANSQLASLLHESSPTGKILHICEDARHLQSSIGTQLPDESVQLIVTSPPYAGAQKYIRASSLSLGWLGLCRSFDLIDLEKKSIGREHFRKGQYELSIRTGIKKADALITAIRTVNPLRAHILSTYLIEMRECMEEMYRVLKKGGYAVLVAGPNQVCGREFPTHRYLSDMAEAAGLAVQLSLHDHIKSRGLMTKRNKTAGVISTEWVYLFRK
jgi:DNA modification methylase